MFDQVFNINRFVFNLKFTMTVNGEPIDFQQEKPLFELLEQLQMHDKKGLAVAVNNTVVPKTNWLNYQLQESDKITIIRATQGG
jgi:sulfur carrier protein